MPLDEWEFELRLNNPITPEQWDLLTDVDFDHTDRIWFHTKHDKDVVFVKEKKGEWIEIMDADEFGEPYPCGVRCSECGFCSVNLDNFCSECGADMRGEE